MYSHGLEKIYAFETINPKSVKAVAIQPKAEVFEEKPLATSQEQLLLPLGPSHEEGLTSFRLKEPIHSLGLSAYAVKVLLSKEVATVEDVHRFITSQGDKGLGQSHIEEILTKLALFVGKNPYSLQKTIDWESIVRTACKDLGSKERYLLLAGFGLESLAPMNPQDTQEVQRYTKEQILKVPSPDIAFFEDSLYDIAQAYLVPWLKSRHGISREDELLNRLEAISIGAFRPICAFISTYSAPIKLLELERGVYASDHATLADYKLVIACANTYFYHPHAKYELSTLVRHITLELAKKGHGFSEGFIEKALTISPSLLITSSNTILKNISPLA